MAKETKLLQITIVDGTIDDIRALQTEIQKVKNSLPYDVEFIVTNDAIQLRDVKYMIDELYKLYKKTKEDKNE